MRIAIASSRGISVDLHFGHADIFHIFTQGESGLILEDRVHVTPLSTGDKKHKFDSERFKPIYEVLAGCSKIDCTKIGDTPKKKMLKKGIKVIEYNGPIAEI